VRLNREKNQKSLLLSLLLIGCFLTLLLYQNCSGGFHSIDSIQDSASSLSSSDPIPSKDPTQPSPEPAPAPQPAPMPTTNPTSKPVIQSFSVNPPVISKGQSAVLSFSVTNAEKLTLSTLGEVTGQTMKTVSPTATATYTLTATNAVGSTTQSITVVISSATPSTLPSWRQGMLPFQWKKIPGTSMSLVKPITLVSGMPDADGKIISGFLGARTVAWNGLAADPNTSRVYSAANGGHADYAGNEVYEIDFSADSPTWIVRREPTAASSIRTSNYNEAKYYDYYLDGRPSSTHTYYALQFLPSKNSIFKIGAGSIFGSGNENNSYIDQFSLDTNDWELGPAGRPFFGLSPRNGGVNLSVCKNPATDEVYINAQDKLKKFDPATNQVTAIAKYFEGPGELTRMPCAVDFIRNQVIFFGNGYIPANGGHKYDMKTGAYTKITFTGSATNGSDSWDQSFAWYDPEIQAFLLKNLRGDKIIRIDPVTYETSVMTTTGGSGMENATNGVQTRFQRMPKLKGYLYYPNDKDGFWFLATE
jgi:hypothetical protein